MIAEVGQVIARRRLARGLDVHELADAAGVATEPVRLLEAGQLGATTVDLERLATFLELDYRALLQGRETDRAEPSIFLRHHANPDFSSIDLPALDEALAQGRALQSLSVLLGYPPMGGLSPRSAVAPKAAQQGYLLARELRRVLGLGRDPLGDACALAEQGLNIAVLVLPMASVRVTALSMRVQDGAAIILNDLDPDRRKNPGLARVHIAHELCHLLHDQSDGGLHLVVDVAIDRERRNQAAEQRARGFAAEFLLPEEGLRARFGPPKGTTSLDEAQKLVREARILFGTPNEIAANHLTNHGFIDPLLREALLMPSSTVTVPPTTLPAAGAVSLQVQVLAEKAHDAGLLTDGQVRELLRIDLMKPLPWDTEVA